MAYVFPFLLQHNFLPGILLAGPLHSKPSRTPGAPGAPAASGGTAAAAASTSAASGGECSGEDKAVENGKGGGSQPAAAGTGAAGAGEAAAGAAESDDDFEDGNKTPAPPSPMHLAEQQELLQLTRVVAAEAQRKRGGEGAPLFGPTQAEAAAAAGSSGKEDDLLLPQPKQPSSPTKRSWNLLQGDCTQRETKRRREDDTAAVDVAEGAAAGPRMPRPPPPQVSASAAMLSAQWYGGACGGMLPVGVSTSAAAEEAAPQQEQQNSAEAAAPEEDADAKPVFCPICNGLYKELPGGGPGDGLHWIGCDCKTTQLTNVASILGS